MLFFGLGKQEQSFLGKTRKYKWREHLWFLENCLLPMVLGELHLTFYLFSSLNTGMGWTCTAIIPDLLRMLELPMQEIYTVAIFVLLGQLGRSVNILCWHYLF